MINDVCGLLESLQSVCVYFSKIAIFNPSHMPGRRESIFLFSFNDLLRSFFFKYYQYYAYNFIKLLISIYFSIRLKENRNNIIFVNRGDFFLKVTAFVSSYCRFDRNDWNNLIDNKAEISLTSVS